MKISEMSNDQATEAMIRLSGPFSAICDDDDALALIDKVSGLGKEKTIRAIGKLIPDFVAFGLKKHKYDFYEIISVLTQTPVEDVGKMNFAKTVREIQDSFDDILTGFFTSSAVAGKLKEKESV